MCMIVNQLYHQLLKNISSSVKSYADNMVKNSIWKWYQKAIQVVILQKATGSSYALLLSFDSIFVQVVSAGESVIPASSFLDFQMCLFTTSILLREMYPHRLQQGFPALHSLFCYRHSVWLPVTARRGTQGDKIACPSQTGSTFVCCQLSSMCCGNHCVVLPRFCLTPW